MGPAARRLLSLAVSAICLCMSVAPAADRTTPEKKTYRIGIITYAGNPPPAAADRDAGRPAAARGFPIQRELARLGYVEGDNVEYLIRAGARDKELTQRYADEIVAWKPDLIISLMTNAHIAVKKATERNQIPVVFWSMDPLGAGVIQSYSRPGTNFTGFSYEPYVQFLLLRFLKSVKPDLKTIGMLYNPTYAPAPGALRDLQRAADMMHVALKVYPTMTRDEFEKSIAAMAADGCEGFVIGPHELFNTNGETIGKLALKYRLPALGVQVSVTRGGGLATYGPPMSAGWVAMAPVIDRILKGEAKPADIPVNRSLKSPLTINVAAAKELGLEIPPWLLDEADEIYGR